MKEIWKDIDGYEGFYQVSNMGRVRSLDRTVSMVRWGRNDTKRLKGRLLKIQIHNKKGSYPYVILAARGKIKHSTIHVLVAAAFIGPRPFKHQVNHKSGDKTNNRVTNLEYLTASDNQKHSFRVLGTHIRRGVEHHMAKLNDEQVIEIRKIWSKGKLSQVAIGKLFNVSFQTVHLIVRNKIWRHI